MVLEIPDQYWMTQCFRSQVGYLAMKQKRNEVEAGAPWSLQALASSE